MRLSAGCGRTSGVASRQRWLRLPTGRRTTFMTAARHESAVVLSYCQGQLVGQGGRQIDELLRADCGSAEACYSDDSGEVVVPEVGAAQVVVVELQVGKAAVLDG